MASKTKLLELIKALRWKEIAQALRESPELLAFRDDRGRNWLHICCGVKVKDAQASPSIKTAEVLLESGLSLDGEAFSEGDWKATPLWYAISRGENLTLAKYLLKRGCSPDHCLWAAAFRSDLDAIRLLVSSGAEVNAIAENETPFLAAIKWSHFEAAEELLKLGADPNYRDPHSMTALHYMLKKSSDKKHFAMLMRHGVRGDIGDKAGVTAIDIMRRKRDPDFRAMAEQLTKQIP